MTDSHIRINISSNWIALQNLSPTSYKILMCLSARADAIGRCYPSCERMAYDANLHVQTVYNAISDLLTYGYIKILRKTYFDPVSGQKMPSVYQVSPQFLEIADKFIEQANNLWHNLGQNVSESFSYINQQQNHVPEQSPDNQPQKQQQQPTSDSDSELQDCKPQTAKSAVSQQPQAVGLQSSLPTQVPPIVKLYTNPVLIRESLPDDRHEMLAQRIADYGIKTTLARGLITQYGFPKCFAAADYLDFTATRQQIDNPAGFYRSIVQSDLIGKYVERQERDYHTATDDDYLEM